MTLDELSMHIDINDDSLCITVDRDGEFMALASRNFAMGVCECCSTGYLPQDCKVLSVYDMKTMEVLYWSQS